MIIERRYICIKLLVESLWRTLCKVWRVWGRVLFAINLGDNFRVAAVTRVQVCLHSLLAVLYVIIGFLGNILQHSHANGRKLLPRAFQPQQLQESP